MHWFYMGSKNIVNFLDSSMRLAYLNDIANICVIASSSLVKVD